MIRLTLLRPTSTRTRMWQAGIALAIAIISMAAANMFVTADKAVTTNMLGMDFLPFYAGGTFARTGHADLLYVIPATRAFEHAVAVANGIQLGDHVGPFWNPPFYALYLAPFAALRYQSALALWTIVNLCALGGSILLMISMLPAETTWRSWALVPLLLLVSMPFVQALSHGQNTFMSLLLLCAAVTAWRARRAVWGGVFCGLLLYKPQLAAVLAIAMTLSLGRRTWIGLGSVMFVFAVVTIIALPGAASAWVHRLPANLHFMQVEQAYAWERHATLKAFWRMLLQGRGPGEATLAVRFLTAVSVAVTAAGLLLVIFRARTTHVDNCWTGETSSLRADRVIACTIAASPLLMPFYFDYDLLLLAVPAVLFAGEMMSLAPGRPRRWSDRWLVRSWCVLFGLLYINSPLASVLKVGVIVPPLAMIVGLSIARGRRRPRMDRSPLQAAEEIGQLLEVRKAA